ncbi:MAG: peptide ABC transporter substrate-binding protein [Oceanicaulis sp.]
MKRIVLTLLGASVLSGCGGETRTGTQTARLESGVLYRNDGPEMSTVDPHLADGSWTQTVIGDLFVGLLRLGRDGEPAPALAESWSVSEDGLVWTFRLRPAQWSDGREITAQDVVYSLRRAVDPATAAAYVDVFAPVVNAEAILAGDLAPDALGVTAPDPATVVIELNHPMPFLPDLLADSRGAVVPRHVIEVHGDSWTAPEHIVTSGAYTLTERVLNQQTVLQRNPRFFDDANTCFDAVYNFPMESPDTAARRARAGELDIAASVPATVIDRVEEDLPGHLRYARPPGTFFFQANTEVAPFGDPRVREALGIALDRSFLFEEVIPSGATVADSLAPASLYAPYPPARLAWAGEPLEVRRARAVALLEDAGFGPDNPLSFEFAYPTGAASDRAVPALQNEWNSLADWVRVEIFGTEPATHYRNLGAGDFEAALGGWIAVIRDVSYMLDPVRDGAAGNFARWSDPEAERLMLAARAEQDPAARADLLRRAEQIALDAFAVTPFHHPERAWIVHPRIEGWIGGPVEYTPSALLCLSPNEPK